MKNKRCIKDLFPVGEMQAVTCALTKAFSDTRTFQDVHYEQLWDIVSGVMVQVERKPVEGELPKLAPIKIEFSSSKGFGIFKKVQNHNVYHCSCCEDVIIPYYKFCPKCGQGVDWSNGNA